MQTQATLTALNNRKHAIRRALCLFVCLLRLRLQVAKCVGHQVSSILGGHACLWLAIATLSSSAIVSQPAHAQSLFSWFTSGEDAKQEDIFTEQQQSPIIHHQGESQQAAFGELTYHYFQKDYQQVLLLIAVGDAKHGFSELAEEDRDRLNLIQGASQLQLGMYKQSQAKFASLLAQTSSAYVQANTWFFMAKAGFDNKQAFLSEKAYAAIAQTPLRNQLSDAQWYELLYNTAYTRMQLQQNWQTLAKQIPTDNIYTTYLLANKATIAFNQGNYEQAVTDFIEAKQSLIAHQNRVGMVERVAQSMFDSAMWFIRPWTWFDSNASAQQNAQEREQSQNIAEQNALFDRINIGLAQSLLQQADLPNAIAVMQNIAQGSAETKQALLSYGWANAKQNRWQAAMSAWQYLQDNSVGLFSLQASYGLAHAFSQQDNLGEAFYALQSTANQIEASLVLLDEFAGRLQQDNFFDLYEQSWPAALGDIKLGFFSPTANFDAKYLLAVRSQAAQVKADINAKQARVAQLNTLLQERINVYAARLQGMSLSSASAHIDQTQQYIDDIHTLTTQADTFEEQVALSKKMSSGDLNQHIDRHKAAGDRYQRLASDPANKRPVKASYTERLERIEGILTWQLMDDFIAQRWQHKQLLDQAQDALNSARAQYLNLQTIAQDRDAFEARHVQFNVLHAALSEQADAADTVYKKASAALSEQLLNMVETRKIQLISQSVNTRLAMLRIQDLQQGDQ